MEKEREAINNYLPKKNKNLKVIIIFASSFVFVGLVFIGLVAFKFYNSFNNNLYDNTSANYLKEEISNSLQYYNEHDEKFTGFILKPFPAEIPRCVGTPILNISENGQKIAIMLKSCINKRELFCGEAGYDYLKGQLTNDSVLIISEDFAKSGKASCK